MLFTYNMPVKIFFGENRYPDITGYVKNKKCIVISDPAMASIGIIEKVCSALEISNYAVFTEVEPNPSCDTVNTATAVARKHGAEMVIGLGGGSPMDTAKAVAALVVQNGSIEEFLHGSKTLEKKRVGLVLIPTTSGTGSEVTNVSVFTDKIMKCKKPLVHDALYADAALIDPSLTISMPQPVTASTGMDALCHAVEAYWAKSSQPMSDFAALGAVKLVMENLSTAYNQPQSYLARSNMALASFAAGVAFSQTRTTVLHALSFPLTNIYNIPHGTACALALSYFIRYNAPYTNGKLLAMAKYAGFESVDEFADAVINLQRSMNMPVTFSDISIPINDIDAIIEITLKANIAFLNPGPIDVNSLRSIFTTMY